MPSVTLKNQIQMPLLGFGVLRMKDPEECERCVEAALDAGYRMFDTAASYGNEEAVGRALNRAVKAGKVRRDELFVITKLWITDAAEALARQGFETSLRKLQMDYIDLCMNTEIPPMVNQIELHPFYHQDRAIKVMRELGVQPQAWAPLCEGLKNIFSNRTLEKVGKKYGKSAAQTALRWNIDRQVSVVLRSSQREHMEEDMGLWDFQLSEADQKAIAPLDLGYSEILDYENPCIARMFNQCCRKGKTE